MDQAIELACPHLDRGLRSAEFSMRVDARCAGEIVLVKTLFARDMPYLAEHLVRPQYLDATCRVVTEVRGAGLWVHQAIDGQPCDDCFELESPEALALLEDAGYCPDPVARLELQILELLRGAKSRDERTLMEAADIYAQGLRWLAEPLEASGPLAPALLVQDIARSLRGAPVSRPVSQWLRRASTTVFRPIVSTGV